jgi:hypothetical protein
MKKTLFLLFVMLCSVMAIGQNQDINKDIIFEKKEIIKEGKFLTKRISYKKRNQTGGY